MTAASAAAAALQLQPDARATKLPETMKEGERERESEWGEGREGSDRKMGEKEKAAGH